tara:strand:+ start:7754 stop:8038 length:285 start_codon:yes stop_codon:yes gene_type:complete
MTATLGKKDFNKMTLQDALNHIPVGSGHDLAIKASGLVGGSTAFAGLSAESTISEWSEISQIAANFGIFISSIVAFFALCYSVYKGTKGKKPND